MHLAVGGHPLHTRALAVTLTHRADGRLDLDSYVLDVRKRGFVPVGGDLQGPGIIHHMLLCGTVDPMARTIDSVTATQPNVAFEPCALSGGESCRDPVGRITGLNGTRFDEAYGPRLGAIFGGPRGCSHLLTLGHLVGSTVPWALTHDAELLGRSVERIAGERVFRRDLILDGHETDDGGMHLGVQLTDLHLAPAPAISAPMQRFAAELEVRALLTVDLATYTLREARIGERRRALADLERAAWHDRSDAVQQLVGLPLMQGFTAEVLRRYGAATDDRPLTDVLLMIGPTLIQCTAALSEQWSVQAKGSASLVGMSGLPDSCYMWRRDGALDRARGADDPLSAKAQRRR